ncbi:hypothetical protein BU17DRAFT_69087 [Hysterangium stoloniferum]|nr:hypothetical protein BU17DRAFT_69087 [Hysterangium stoloniferum]
MFECFRLFLACLVSVPDNTAAWQFDIHVTQLLKAEAYHISCIDNEALIPTPTDSLPNTYEMDEITRTTDVVGLPPTISSSAAVTIADFQLSNDEIMRITNAHNMLREQWGCDEPGHELCLQGKEFVDHIQLSKEQISIWIGEICRGQATCRYPPKAFIVPDGSGSNRNLNFDWGASETTTDTEVEIEPGYFCGLALERIGGIILYHSKVWVLCAKLLVYKRIVNRPYEITSGLYKRPSARMLGIILQETVDLMRFCIFRYPTEAYLSPEIMSALYRNLTGGQLHIHYDEVLSTCVVILARYVAASWEPYHFLLSALTFLAANLCHLRKLSFKELDAIHDYLESSLQKQNDPYSIYLQMRVSTSCSQQDARFHILSEALMDIALDTTIGTTLRHNGPDMFRDAKGLAVHIFFADRVLLIDDVKKMSRIASHFSTPFHLWLSDGLSSTIKTITSLIAASPNPEYYCRKLRAGNVVNVFVDFFSRFDPLDFCYLPCDLEAFSRLKADSDSLLLLIANPFTGRSVLSSSYCMSILEDNGWVGNAPSASN